MTAHSTRRALLGALVTAAAGAFAPAQAWITFTDQTATRLPTSASFLNDTDEKDFCIVDIDHDGDLDFFDVQKNDIYATVSPRTHRLLLNTGTGSFIEGSAAYVPDFATHPSIGRLGIAKDFDGDGWEDLVVVNTNPSGASGANTQQLEMYRNLGNDANGQWLGMVYDTAGRFPQYTAPAARFCAGDAGDYDLDGDQDLYLGDYNNSLEDKLLFNNGAGIFTDVTATRIPGGTSSTFTVEIITADFNNDGWPDIGISDGTVGLVKIRVNNGAGFFNTLVQPPNAATYTLGAGDLNNDGWIDLYQGRDAQDAYNINTTTVVGSQSLTFTTQVLTNSPGTQNFAGNVNVVDMDNDGFKDIVMGDIDVDVPDCTRHATLLKNNPLASPSILSDPYLANGSCSSGCQPWHSQGTHDIAVIDINGDGHMDMIYGKCSGYTCWIQTPPPITLTLSEPAPGALTLAVTNGPAFTQVFNLATLVQLPVPGTGPFFGLDASALLLFADFFPAEPFVGFTNGSGAYTFAFPAGTFPQTQPWTWQARTAYLAPAGLTLSNVETKTF
ncbi:MAG TPA: VCBS repeat-containing protein [Planctomycetota bacterium]|nr:VCBS repeat-containing protein [Planctomycetota bacterium]